MQPLLKIKSYQPTTNHIKNKNSKCIINTSWLFYSAYLCSWYYLHILELFDENISWCSCTPLPYHIFRDLMLVTLHRPWCKCLRHRNQQMLPFRPWLISLLMSNFPKLMERMLLMQIKLKNVRCVVSLALTLWTLQKIEKICFQHSKKLLNAST